MSKHPHEGHFTSWLTAHRPATPKAPGEDAPDISPTDAPAQTAGIISGPGNQGSANTAHLAGQAGTAGTFIALPRQLKVGQSGAKPQ